MKLSIVQLTIAATFALFLVACTPDKPVTPPTPEPTPAVEVTIPIFNKDSAYQYIQTQVDFGPRVPETAAHAACAKWIEGKLASFGWQTQVQEAVIDGWDSKTIVIKNIIGSYKPELKNRVLLCAHWDTRRITDQDAEFPDKPGLGADDGGSGVGIFLEIARVVAQANDLNVGLDIVFFDAEDQGESRSPRPAEQSWCLGSQYWSRNMHPMAAKPQFGILLDMAGSKNARFPMEGVSSKRAPAVHQAVWREARSLGYSDLFVTDRAQDLIDDHVYVNDIAKIPTIDIINLPTNPSNNGTFGAYWHTQQDNMDIIGKHTLNAVGQVVLTSLYKHEKDALY